MLYQIHNISTFQKSRDARRSAVVRTRKVLLDGQRVMPHRHLTVQESALIRNRERLLDYQERGLIEIRTGDGVPFKLTKDGPINPPAPPARPRPAFTPELPPDLRGERRFTHLQKDGEGEWEGPRGWTKMSPMVDMNRLDETLAPPKQQSTALENFPEEVRQAAQTATPGPMPALAELLKPMGPPAPVEDPVTDPIPEEPAPPTPAPEEGPLAALFSNSGAEPEELLMDDSAPEAGPSLFEKPAAPAPQNPSGRGKGRRRR